MPEVKFDPVIAGWLGISQGLPFIEDVENPKHGQKARNSRRQKVIYDADKGKWVMPQNFSGRKPLTIKGNGYIYTEFGIFDAETDPEMEHPLTIEQVQELREAKQHQYWVDKLAAEGITCDRDDDVWVINGVKVKGAKWAYKELKGLL